MVIAHCHSAMLTNFLYNCALWSAEKATSLRSKPRHTFSTSLSYCLSAGIVNFDLSLVFCYGAFRHGWLATLYLVLFFIAFQ